MLNLLYYECAYVKCLVLKVHFYYALCGLLNQSDLFSIQFQFLCNYLLFRDNSLVGLCVWGGVGWSGGMYVCT